jgi:hypothetical protein
MFAAMRTTRIRGKGVPRLKVRVAISGFVDNNRL